MCAIGGSCGPANSGRIFIRLKPRDQRKIRRCRMIAANSGPSSPRFPESAPIRQNPPTIRIGGRLSKSLYQYTLQGARH